METNEIINNDVIEETTEVVAKASNGNLWVVAGIGAAAVVGGIIIAGKKFVAPKIAEFKENRANKKRVKCVDNDEVVVEATVCED